MSAIVTDQFRINNAGNFLGDVNNTSNSYYVFVGLSNPSVVNNPNAFGRNESDAQWNDQSTRKTPVDSINYLNHVRDTMIFGKKIGILGAAKSGISAARLAVEMGYEVVLSDVDKIRKLIPA